MELTARRATAADADEVTNIISLAFANDPLWSRTLARPGGQTDHHGAYWRFIIDSAQFGYKKPSLRIFRHAIDRAGLSQDDASRVLFVGDRNDLDILPARQIGMNVLHFNRSRSRDKVESAARDVPVVYDWADFR